MAPKKLPQAKAPAPAAGKRKVTAAALAAAAAPAKKTRPHRTPQTPFEQTDETLYAVDKIINMRFVKGSREYLVRWEGYSTSHDTWEPMDNLVGCAEQIRAYEKQREKEDKDAAALVLHKRQEAKAAAEAEAAALKARAAEAALEGAGDGTANAADDASGVLKAHAKKKGSVWLAFDLTVDKPSCCLLKNGGWPEAAGGELCGAVPSATAGTQNYWSHLWTHHRAIWYELKRRDGALNPAGDAALLRLKEGLANMAEAGTALAHSRGGEFLSRKLPPAQKETMDRVVAEWIVDEDQSFNAASTPGYRRMMAVATGGKYDGCIDTTVEQHVMAMGMEGKAECTDFHRELLAAGVKPAASGDLWSKNSTALFGLVSHGIRRTELEKLRPDGSKKVKWEMVEKLAGAVPCSKHRHTGDHIGEMSNTAWADTGIKKPIEELYVRISDNGSNMIKGWEEGFQAPCSDHTMELSVNLYTNHPRLAPTFDKGRGQVGYFNSSVVGYNEEGKGLHACQKQSGVAERRLTQDVKTRWRSTHGLTDSLRANQEPLLFYDVRNPNGQTPTD